MKWFLSGKDTVSCEVLLVLEQSIEGFKIEQQGERKRMRKKRELWLNMQSEASMDGGEASLAR